jgi:elongation factor G
MDDENADFDKVLGQMHDMFGTGIVSMEDQSALVEAASETDEALMEKFFNDEPLTPDELQSGIRNGIKEGSLTPVLCGTAVKKRRHWFFDGHAGQIYASCL